MSVPRVGPFAPLTSEVRQENLTRTLAGKPDEIWVFGYGSLMWDSCFKIAERRPATLRGYRRGFCVWTAHARGTPDNPGLGLGLLPAVDAICGGVALRIATAARQSGLEALWMREMWTGVYNPVWVSLETSRGPLTALAFVVETGHPQYAAGLSTLAAATRIATARGVFGTCRNYFDETLNFLREQGINDEELNELRKALDRLAPTQS